VDEQWTQWTEFIEGSCTTVAYSARKLATALAGLVGTSEHTFAIRRSGEDLSELKPDLVYAMRLPYEGLFAAAAVNSAPLLISIWGNDLTLFAEGYRRLGVGENGSCLGKLRFPDRLQMAQPVPF
jgi:hypothetical protein